LDEVGRLYSERKLNYHLNIIQGLENAVDSLVAVLEGNLFGQAIIYVADCPPIYTDEY